MQIFAPFGNSREIIKETFFNLNLEEKAKKARFQLDVNPLSSLRRKKNTFSFPVSLHCIKKQRSLMFTFNNTKIKS